MKHYRTLVLSPLLFAICATPALGQEDHVVSTSELRAAVVEQAANSDRDRDAVLRVLARDEVRAVADQVGVDLSRAEDAVATLDGPELQRLADRSRTVEKALVGGDAIVISTTAVIIGLLVLIVILLID
ncbi:MAG: PA2779 family protein [Gemmatimonadales bacterium]|jgi:hypothetical protein